jgi:hypothetical protein
MENLTGTVAVGGKSLTIAGAPSGRVGGLRRLSNVPMPQVPK